MRSVVYAFLGASFTIATAWALGTLLLRKLSISLGHTEDRLLAFITGSACLGTIVFALCTVGLARKGVFLVFGLIVIFLGIRIEVRHPRGESKSRLPRAWRWVFIVLCSVITVVYVLSATTPELTPGLVTHRLSLLDHTHGFIRNTNDANSSRGFELLLLFAFALGRHAAAVLVNVGLMVSLALLVLCYGLRIGHPAVGIAGAMLTCLSPLLGKPQPLANIDVGIAIVLFALFYSLQKWDEHGAQAFLVPIGVLAGFSYAAHYAAVTAVPYALGFITWKLWRKRKPVLHPVVIVGGVALMFTVPWMIRDWMWLGSALSQFVKRLDSSDLPCLWALLMLGLPTLWLPQGRPLLLAAVVLGLPYSGNAGGPPLMPVVPFASLALALVLSNFQWFAAQTRTIAHAPAVAPHYARIARVPRVVWIIFAVFGLWLVSYTNRSATVKAYFRLENAWVEHWPVKRQRQAVTELAPVLYRIGVLRPARIQVEPGVSFLLDARDLIASSILRGGAWQPEIWDSISPSLSEEGSVFLDVGAHIGYFSMKAAVRVGRTGRVVAFEPNPETLKLLRDNVTANHAQNVIVEPIACTDREQTLTLYAAPSSNTGASSLARQNADISAEEAPRPYAVRGRRIDDVVRELNLPRVDAMKIDVEGAEVYVLRGAVSTLKHFHPKLVIEVVPRQLASLHTTAEELISIINDAGYNHSKPVGPTDWEWTMERTASLAVQ